ncbi:MAG TPA: SpoIIE family protein phosphatase [Terriglobales bacterium]|nr:SpoIIE family protein phosphatase [Terriglobales bacterium]
MAKLSPWLIQLLRRQQIFIVMGVVVYAMIVTLRIPVSLTGTLICALICGNLTTLFLQWLNRACSRQGFPYNWLVFTGCLALVTPLTVTISILVVAWILFPPEILTWKIVGPWWEFSCIATMVFGLIYYTYIETRQRLERRNRELAQALDQGAARLESQDQELQRAREIQESLLPRKIPQIDGFEIAGTWQPARTVGGDYFDILKFADQKLAFCIADVVGKGVSAALLMANIQAAVRAFASESASPAWLCSRINNALPQHR